MKRVGSISCICTTLLLSSCSLTQQHPPLTDAELAAQKRAAIELDAALEAEEARLAREAREAELARAAEEARREAEKKAREEAERLAEEAERQAEEAREQAEEAARQAAEEEAERREAEEAARETGSEARRTPTLLNSRGQKPAAKSEKQEDIRPTAEQQEAARALLAQKPATSRTPEPEAEQKPAPKAATQPEEAELPGSVMRGALRTRRFAPPEEAISRDNDDEPLPNSVELRGLRSPVMKDKLPMNIDGKIIKN